MELPFSVEVAKFDEEKHIRMRVLSEKDWGRVDWSIGKLLDESQEAVEVENILVDIHGGSFNGGSPEKQNQYTKYFAMKTGWVVFSLDYRLAPGTKFPANLSDCLQGYLWVAYYAEKYLKIRAKNIIIEGDSAGGNLSMGVTTLAIQKQLRIPDKCLFNYPCCGAAKQKFSPSLWLTIDEVILNHTYISPWIDFYVKKEDQVEGNYYMVTNYIPDKYLSKFPKTMMVVLGLDPLRDDAIRLTLRMAKLNVDVKAIEFRHWMHGLFFQRIFPFNIPMATKALDRAWQFILE
jgi:acetyl esterase